MHTKLIQFYHQVNNLNSTLDSVSNEVENLKGPETKKLKHLVHNIDVQLNQLLDSNQELSNKELADLNAAISLLKNNVKVLSKKEKSWISNVVASIFPSWGVAVKRERKRNEMITKLAKLEISFQKRITKNENTPNLGHSNKLKLAFEYLKSNENDLKLDENRLLLKLIENDEFKSKSLNLTNNLVKDLKSSKTPEEVFTGLRTEIKNMSGTIDKITGKKVFAETTIITAALIASKDKLDKKDYEILANWIDNLGALETNEQKQIWGTNYSTAQGEFSSWKAGTVAINEFAKSQFDHKLVLIGKKYKEVYSKKEKQIDHNKISNENYASLNKIHKITLDDNFRYKVMQKAKEFNDIRKSEGHSQSQKFIKNSITELTNYCRQNILDTKGNEDINKEVISAILIIAKTLPDNEYGALVYYIKEMKHHAHEGNTKANNKVVPKKHVEPVQIKTQNQRDKNVGIEMKKSCSTLHAKLVESKGFENPYTLGKLAFNYESKNYIANLIDAKGFQTKTAELIVKANQFDPSKGGPQKTEFFRIEFSKLFTEFSKNKEFHPDGEDIFRDNLISFIIAGSKNVSDEEMGKFTTWVEQEDTNLLHNKGGWERFGKGEMRFKSLQSFFISQFKPIVSALETPTIKAQKLEAIDKQLIHVGISMKAASMELYNEVLAGKDSKDNQYILQLLKSQSFKKGSQKLINAFNSLDKSKSSFDAIGKFKDLCTELTLKFKNKYQISKDYVQAGDGYFTDTLVAMFIATNETSSDLDLGTFIQWWENETVNVEQKLGEWRTKEKRLTTECQFLGRMELFVLKRNPSLIEK